MLKGTPCLHFEDVDGAILDLIQSVRSAKCIFDRGA
jgi:hypothetical protein